MKNIIAQLKRIWRLSKICHETKLREEHRKRVSAPIRYCNSYCKYRDRCMYFRNWFIAVHIARQRNDGYAPYEFNFCYIGKEQISKDECSESNPRLFKRDKNWLLKLFD